MDTGTPLVQVLNSAPETHRLRSRRPFYNSEIAEYSGTEKWRAEWATGMPRGGFLVEDPTEGLPGFHATGRKYWAAANRIRSGHGRTAVNMHRWGLWDSPLCPKCHLAPQDTDHLVLHCPVTSLNGGYLAVHEMGDDFIAWMDEHNVEV